MGKRCALICDGAVSTIAVVQVRADGGLDRRGSREEGQALEEHVRGTAGECWGRRTKEEMDSGSCPALVGHGAPLSLRPVEALEWLAMAPAPEE